MAGEPRSLWMRQLGVGVASVGVDREGPLPLREGFCSDL